jgi:hypothetical protein
LTYGSTSNFLAKLIPISGIVFWLFASWAASAAWMTFYHHCLTGISFWAAPRYPQTFPGHQELQRKVLTAKPVKAWNKPNWDSLREGVNALIASLIATIITLTCLVWLFYAAAPEGIEESQIHNAVTYQVLNTVAALISAGMTGAKFNQPITEVLSEQGFEPLVNAWFIVFWLWVASVLLLYQCDLWARRRRAAKQERRSQNSTTPAPNPIEQELNQLSADAGATRMRPVRQAGPKVRQTAPKVRQVAPKVRQVAPKVRQTVSEVADWYVFRSGKAEGPYTKLQLWEVQEITARTKVRRGEGDWQRAGEVSELAKYLTDK